MARRAHDDPGASAEPRDKQMNFRLSTAEEASLRQAATALGVPYPADALRAMPRLLGDREALLRAALEPARAVLDRDDVNLVLAAMNGVHMMRDLGLDGEPNELLGQHLALEVHDTGTYQDGRPSAELAARLHALPLATRIALELWASDLWRRHEEHELWEREIAWLSS